jgi:hypothetical protein
MPSQTGGEHDKKGGDVIESTSQEGRPLVSHDRVSCDALSTAKMAVGALEFGNMNFGDATGAVLKLETALP